MDDEGVDDVLGAAFWHFKKQLVEALSIHLVVKGEGDVVVIDGVPVAADAIPEVGVGCPVVDGGLAVLVGNARVDVPAFFLNEDVFTLV